MGIGKAAIAIAVTLGLALAVIVVGPFIVGAVGGALFGGNSCTVQGQVTQLSGADNEQKISDQGLSLPQATIDYLDKRHVKELAQQNMERYSYAQKETGVPWQVIAALHYREAGMNPASSISNGAPLGSGENVDGVNVVGDPNQDAANMAKLFVRMAKSVYDIDVTNSASSMTTQQWGEAFLAYNRGFLYIRQNATYDQSPYVTNGLDESHMNMRWTAADTVSGVDGNKAGALAVMEYLGGISQSGSCSNNNSGWHLPLDPGYAVTDVFGPRYHPVYHECIMHQGYDLGDPIGTKIYAAHSGTIKEADMNGGYGNFILIDHGGGIASAYGHLSAYADGISPGVQVTTGQLIGYVGATGDATGPHLHFEIRVNGKQVDPAKYLQSAGIQLVTKDTRISSDITADAC